MKKTTVYLPEDLYEGLQVLAYERKTTVAALIRHGLNQVYGRLAELIHEEDLEDIRDMEEELAKYKADPSIAVDYEEYRRQRLGYVSIRDNPESQS